MKEKNTNSSLINVNKNVDINWFEMEEEFIKTMKFKWLSYQLNFDNLKDLYENSDLEKAYNFISIPILFNKRNRKIFIISVFIWVIVTIFILALYFCISSVVLYLLLNYTKINFSAVIGIYYAIMIIFSIFYGLVSFLLDFKKEKGSIKKKVKRKKIYECSFINMYLWVWAKYFWKFKKLYEDKTNNYFNEWKKLIDDSDYKLILVFALFFGCFVNVKNLEIKSIKIKKFKNNIKPINLKIRILMIILGSYFFKFISRFFIFLVISTLPYILVMTI